MDIVDVNVLVFVAAASFVLAKFWDIVKDRLAFWPKLPEWGREVGGYVMIVASGLIMWSTALNALPGFGHPYGRLLTCIIGALGPGAVYDCFLDKPKPPTLSDDDLISEM
jgi:hypothetical protein